MISNTLATLLTELKCRTNVADIPPDDQAAVCSFLKQENEARIVHRLQRLLVTSGMQKQQLRTFEQFDWTFNSSLPRQEISSFRSSPWIKAASNLVLIGDVGIGKSHLAKSLCYDAIQQGHLVYFTIAFDLISKIRNALNCSAKIDYFGKSVKVLCIDELGYTVYHKDDTDIIYQIIAKRSELLPTIITTNLVPKNWGSIFSGPAASAILNRLSASGTFLTWEGNSYRKHGKKKY